MFSSIKPKVTVVTVAKDNAAGLLSTIESLKMQEYSDWKAIIIVPKSSSETLKVAEEVLTDSRFLALHDQGQGIYEAMNLGLEKCRSEYVWFMNAGDCFPRRESIEEILAMAEKEQADLILGRHAVFGRSDGSRAKRDFLNRLTRFRFAFNLRSGCHQAMLFRTSKLSDLGGYSTKYRLAADFDAVLKIVSFGKAFRTSRVCAVVQPGGVADSNLKLVFREKHQIRINLMKLPHYLLMSLAWTFLANLNLGIRHTRRARM
jgi:glycosyltransferase involved in cell wall biosynthesis